MREKNLKVEHYFNKLWTCKRTCEEEDIRDLTPVKENCQHTESHTVILSASNNKTWHCEKCGEERGKYYWDKTKKGMDKTGKSMGNKGTSWEN